MAALFYSVEQVSLINTVVGGITGNAVTPRGAGRERRERPYSNDAVAISGPMSTSKSSLIISDDLRRRFFPPTRLASAHTWQVQNGTGIDGAAAVPRKVTCIYTTWNDALNGSLAFRVRCTRDGQTRQAYRLSTWIRSGAYAFRASFSLPIHASITMTTGQIIVLTKSCILAVTAARRK